MKNTDLKQKNFNLSVFLDCSFLGELKWHLILIMMLCKCIFFIDYFKWYHSLHVTQVSSAHLVKTELTMELDICNN